MLAKQLSTKTVPFEMQIPNRAIASGAAVKKRPLIRHPLLPVWWAYNNLTLENTISPAV